ncbi:hypothetical protein BCR44DRAFT_397541 [Catenaria anguillulae PL171]|uniref:Uncharacterized protein n=1 Tax=Catenaria anguillulae PL171 TaxID=765915 RepID=A0A1Y2GH61_9FUNG|nr:hypothetical protein BCR44DRAFT_397541 [Catenaria anguillulae PL171]
MVKCGGDCPVIGDLFIPVDSTFPYSVVLLMGKHNHPTPPLVTLISSAPLIRPSTPMDENRKVPAGTVPPSIQQLGLVLRRPYHLVPSTLVDLASFSLHLGSWLKSVYSHVFASIAPQYQDAAWRQAGPQTPQERLAVTILTVIKLMLRMHGPVNFRVPLLFLRALVAFHDDHARPPLDTAAFIRLWETLVAGLGPMPDTWHLELTVADNQDEVIVAAFVAGALGQESVELLTCVKTHKSKKLRTRHISGQQPRLLPHFLDRPLFQPTPDWIDIRIHHFYRPISHRWHLPVVCPWVRVLSLSSMQWQTEHDLAAMFAGLNNLEYLAMSHVSKLDNTGLTIHGASMSRTAASGPGQEQDDGMVIETGSMTTDHGPLSPSRASSSASRGRAAER